MPYGILGHAACFSDAAGLCALDSSTMSVAPAPAFEDSVALAVAPSVSIKSPIVVTDHSLAPTLLAVVVESPANR